MVVTERRWWLAQRRGDGRNRDYPKYLVSKKISMIVMKWIDDTVF